MPHYVYVLQSRKTGRYYVGSTQDPDQRLTEHNAGNTRSTKGGIPWVLLATGPFNTLAQARRVEARLKAAKSRRMVGPPLTRWVRLRDRCPP